MIDIPSLGLMQSLTIGLHYFSALSRTIVASTSQLNDNVEAIEAKVENLRLNQSGIC